MKSELVSRAHKLEGIFDCAAKATDADLDALVAKINQVVRRSTLECALNIGRLIVHHFYGGDTNAWRARGPKAASFRQLAARRDLQMSAGAIYRCVAVFEIFDRLNGERWPHLGICHYRSLLSFPSDVQERLLAVAHRERWSVHRLETEARKCQPLRNAGGRRAAPAAVRGILEVEAALSKHHARLADGDELMLPYQIESLRAALARIRSRLAALEQSLRTVSLRDSLMAGAEQTAQD